MPARSNLSVLTQSHKAIASKKRAKQEQVKEVVFDDDARREFLTGFHKRKTEKKDAAKKRAIEREKQERLKTRREQRRMLAERAVANAAEVEKAYGGAVDNDASNDEFSRPNLPSSSRRQQRKLQGQPVEPEEEEYEDEEQLATVTVVEDFDPDTIIHGPQRIRSSPGSDGFMEHHSRLSTEGASNSNSTTMTSIAKTEQAKARAKANLSVKTKLKMSKKVKYQTKAERGLEKKKQRTRRTEKAERAGGKASRSSNSRSKGKKR